MLHELFLGQSELHRSHGANILNCIYIYIYICVCLTYGLANFSVSLVCYVHMSSLDVFFFTKCVVSACGLSQVL